jgi:hypothetical protein
VNVARCSGAHTLAAVAGGAVLGGAIVFVWLPAHAGTSDSTLGLRPAPDTLFPRWRERQRP